MRTFSRAHVIVCMVMPTPACVCVFLREQSDRMRLMMEQRREKKNAEIMENYTSMKALVAKKVPCLFSSPNSHTYLTPNADLGRRNRGRSPKISSSRRLRKGRNGLLPSWIATRRLPCAEAAPPQGFYGRGGLSEDAPWLGAQGQQGPAPLRVVATVRWL